MKIIRRINCDVAAHFTNIIGPKQVLIAVSPSAEECSAVSFLFSWSQATNVTESRLIRYPNGLQYAECLISYSRVDDRDSTAS